MNFCLQHLHDRVDRVVSQWEQYSAASPANGKWSAAQILEHLFLTYKGTVRGVERALESGQVAQATATTRNRFGRLLVLHIGYFPKGRKSPPGVIPKGSDERQILAAIGPQIVKLDAALSQAEEKFGRRGQVLEHPLLGPFTADDWRKFHLVHGKHHLRQIHQLQKANH
jgi:hypothetical protein